MIVFLFHRLVKTLLWFRYRVRIKGMDEVAARGKSGILFLANHPALIDPIILLTFLGKKFRPRALGDRDQVDRFLIRTLARKIGVLEIPDLAKRGTESRAEVAEAIGSCVGALADGDNLLLYPSGHIYASRYEDLRGNSAVETILKTLPDVRVVLIRTRGLWGSSFSLASGERPGVGKILKRGLGWLLASGLFFAPRRKITIELHESADLPRSAGRETLNGFIEDYFNADAPPNTYVPRTIWDRRGLRELDDPPRGIGGGDIEAVPPTTRKIVTEYLRDITGRAEMRDDEHLARDLGLDSLARADLIVWLEKEFGFAQGDVDALQTVADVMLSACGESISALVRELKPISAKWFARLDVGSERIADGDDLAEVFLNKALKHPTQVIAADQSAGVRTYRQMITAIFALKDKIAALDGEYVGIMLPASVAADTVYLATIFAGKTPVMVNWTVGPRNMVHSLDLVGVKTILTSELLKGRLETQGVDFTGLDGRFVFLEKVSGAMTRLEKLSAYICARLAPRLLLKTKVTETAVVLFTSGSESLPKAVPLTHKNLLTNIRDVIAHVNIMPTDRILSILPPFHSFGLTGGVLAPLLVGAPVVHHPNPTEAPMLARIAEAYQATVLLGTPTFLAGMVRATTGDQLASLRMAVTGGEKCPERVYAAIANACANAIVLEGYGVTECSPIISVNQPEAPKHGTIGKIMPSLESVIVNIDTNERSGEGEAGMLLVRGASVFGGYLNYDGKSPFVQFDGKDWYRTGDLVSIDSDGVITFRGRLKRFIKLGGEMISLPAVEAVLNQHYASESDEGPVLAVEATPSEDHPEIVLFSAVETDRETVNNQIREAGLSPLHNVRRIIHIDEIPLLGTGKTDYRTLSDRLA